MPIKIVQKKKHCRKPAPPGIYKIEGEGIGGRKKDYAISEIANMELPTMAKDGTYSPMSIVESSRFSLNRVCSAHSITGYPSGNNPADYIVVLVMKEDIHGEHLFKVVLLNRLTKRLELITSSDYPLEDKTEYAEGVGLVVPAYEAGWYIWKKASLNADIIFWKTLKEYSRALLISSSL